MIKERIKRKLLKDHPEVTEAWFEQFYKDGLTETIATSGFPHTPVSTAPAPAAAPAPTNTVSSPTGSNTGSTGSSSSRGKAKRVKKEN